MAPQHGVFVYELPTSVIAPVRTARAKVFIGTAPVHRSKNPEAVSNSQPFLAYSYAEAVQGLGFSSDWETWTLCEAIKSQFRLYAVAPVVFINVFDPTKNVTDVPGSELIVKNGKAEISDINAIPSSIVVYTEEDGDLCAVNEDYILELTAEGLSITTIPGGLLFPATSLWVEYKVVDPSTVTVTDVVGGVDGSTGARTGIEAIEDIFPKYRLVPDLIAAPGWDDTEVSIALMAKAQKINGLFKCMAVVDIPESAGASYRDIPSWKELSGLTSEYVVPCFGRLGLGSEVYHLSTQLVGLMGRVDADWGDVPFASPSNNGLKMDKFLWKGEEVLLGHDQANYVSSNGIVTALNFIGGWRAWGNRTGAYPALTDPKDMWIPVRRMFNWFTTELILTYWQKVSLPIRGVLIDNIVSSLNNRLAGLAGAGYIIGGRMDWNQSENPLTNIIDGVIKFHIYMTSPPPAETIDFWIEYDPVYFEMLATAISG